MSYDNISIDVAFSLTQQVITPASSRVLLSEAATGILK